MSDADRDPETGETPPVDGHAGKHEVDESELEETRRALRLAEHRVALAERTLRLGYIDWCLADNAIDVSATARKILGLPHDGALSADEVSASIHPDDIVASMQALADVMEGRAMTASFIARTRGHDAEGGSERAEFHLSRVEVGQDADGRPMLWGTVADVSEQEVLRRRNEELNVQLEHAQRMESVGRLAAGVAHDFNNHLSAISALAGLAADEADDPKRLRADLESIRVAVKRASFLTRQLLSFSRRGVSDPCVLHVNTSVETSMELVRRLVGERVRLEYSPAEQDLWVLMDAGQLDQIIVNLCTNARDAMPSGGLLSVSIRAVTDGGGETRWVAFEVADEGVGIPADLHAKIFDPFFTTKPSGKGTGLGLSIIRRIVADAGGSLTLQSEVGVGTRVGFRIPAIDGEVKAPRSAESQVGGDETILLCEDDLAVRTITGRVLQGRGYRVILAADVGEALASAADATIDLLVTDVILPDGDGRTLHAQLLESHSELRVLYVSGYSDEILGRDGQLDPGIRFLSKPFDAEQLLAAVRSALDADDGESTPD